MSRNGKIIICNAVILLICVAAIVTLSVGSFWKADISITVKGADVAKATGGSGEGEGSSEGYKAMEGIELTLPISLNLKSADLMGSVTKKGSEATKSIINSTLSGAIDSLLDQVDDIMIQLSEVAVDAAVDTLKDELAKEMTEGATEEQIDAELQEKYGITNEDVDTLKGEISDTLKAMINGEEGDVVNVVRNSATLDKVCEALVKEQGSGEGTELTPEQIQQKTAEMKEGFVEKYDEMVSNMSVDGKLNSESMLTSVMNTAGLKDENGEEKKFEDTEDVKAYLADKVYGMVEEHADVISKILMAFGIFIIFVIACWGYVIVKIFVKLFMKNKTVRVGLPQAFGWMPHVFFVGLPMTFLKLAPVLIKKLPEQTGEQIQELLNTVTDMLNVTISSLTWVSALCAVCLLFVTIPYYRYRRQIKKEKKAGTGIYGSGESYENMDFSE